MKNRFPRYNVSRAERPKKERPAYAKPTWTRMVDIMAVGHRNGYNRFKGHDLIDIMTTLHPEVTRGSASAALARLSKDGYSRTELVELEAPDKWGRTEFRYHTLTYCGMLQSRFVRREHLRQQL